MNIDLIPVVAIVFGSILAIVVITGLFSLIKTWINRGKHTLDEEKFDRLARAFIRYKKDNDQRLNRIEAMITDGEPDKSSGSKQVLKKKTTHHSIEIDNLPDGKQQSRESSPKSNLPNMLNK